MHSHIERRLLASEFEYRTNGDSLRIVGYALKWRTRSKNLGGFVEEVAHGATTKTIRDDDICSLFNHDPNLILGRNISGTLRLTEDDVGLEYEVKGDLRQSYVRDLAVALDRGDVNKSSFAFRAVGQDGDTWDEDDGGTLLRTLREIHLYDVSPVTYPAYDDTTSAIQRRTCEVVAEQRGMPLDAVRADFRNIVLGRADPSHQPPDCALPVYELPVEPTAALWALRRH